jgi:hypothetical protein
MLETQRSLEAPLPSTSSYCNATSQTHGRNSKILGKAKEKQKNIRKERRRNEHQELDRKVMPTLTQP